MTMTEGGAAGDRQVRHWNAVAEGWGDWLEWTERNFEPLTAWFRDATGWVPGTRILDVACGAGYPARAAAHAVRPGGRVVAVDLSMDMLHVAETHAAVAGLDDIEFVQGDAERLRFPDASFDIVINSYGLMFCADPLRALREARRVLAPGGRVALAVWDAPDKSPFFTVIRDVASRFIGLVEPGPGEPGPFRLASAQVLRALLDEAGFATAHVKSLSMTVDCASAADYCRMFADLSWKARVAALSRDDAARFTEAVARAAQPFTVAGRIRLVATSLCACAQT